MSRDVDQAAAGTDRRARDTGSGREHPVSLGTVPPLPESAAGAVGERYRGVSVPVRGGGLRVGVWEPEGGSARATVLAVHGITASHLSWPLLARALPEVRLVTPDLRGRGGSRDLPEPYGMPTHADDVAAVLESLAGEDGPVVVVGHSMGAFVAMVLADRRPELVRSLVLVDGGLPLLPPDGVSPEQLAAAVLGPAAERLAMTFPDCDAYRDFWRPHPAFARDWTPELEAYVDYDLAGEAPRLRPATCVEAMHGDVRELTGSEALLGAWERRRRPARVLLAPRGLMDEVPPLYPQASREVWASRYPDLPVDEVPDVNHYTIVLSARGARAVADVVTEELASSG